MTKVFRNISVGADAPIRIVDHSRPTRIWDHQTQKARHRSQLRASYRGTIQKNDDFITYSTHR